MEISLVTTPLSGKIHLVDIVRGLYLYRFALDLLPGKVEAMVVQVAPVQESIRINSGYLRAKTKVTREGDEQMKTEELES